MSVNNKIVISMLGSKGGTGKTTLSHMLAHGLARLGFMAVVAHTDTDRRSILPDEHRAFRIMDASDKESLDRVIKWYSDIELPRDAIVIFDGGGSRSVADKYFIKLSHLALIPFQSYEVSAEKALDNFREYQDDDADGVIRLLPNDWPTNALELQKVEKIFAPLLEPIQSRVMKPVPHSPAIRDFVSKDIKQVLPSGFNSVCRALAVQALEQVEIEPFKYSS